MSEGCGGRVPLILNSSGSFLVFGILRADEALDPAPGRAPGDLAVSLAFVASVRPFSGGGFRPNGLRNGGISMMSGRD